MSSCPLMSLALPGAGELIHALHHTDRASLQRLSGACFRASQRGTQRTRTIFRVAVVTRALSLRTSSRQK